MYDEGAVPVVVRNGVPDTVLATTLTPVLYLGLGTTISKFSKCLERNKDSNAWCGWSSHFHRFLFVNLNLWRNSTAAKLVRSILRFFLLVIHLRSESMKSNSIDTSLAWYF